MTTAGHHMRM